MELQTAVNLKKVPPDTWFLLAEVLWATGKKKAAKGHYGTFLKKAKKRDFPDETERAKARQ